MAKILNLSKEPPEKRLSIPKIPALPSLKLLASAAALTPGTGI